jgi:hypothetical protein
MATNRPRRVSPPAYRRYDPRASTGTVFSSSFDSRPSPYPRANIDTLPTSRTYEAQPIAKKIYQDPGYSGGTTSRTEYAVRPRINSLTAEDRRPPSLVIPPHSPARSRPLVNNPSRDRPLGSPQLKPHNPRDDSERYIYPAVSSPRQSHQRHYSATPIDIEHLRVADRDRRERARYRDLGASGYPTSGAAIRYRDDDVSYTGPREQFDRDYPSGSPVRRDIHPRRDRPLSALDFADWKPPQYARREPGPPPSAFRPPDRIDRADAGRANIRSGTAGDNDRDDDMPRRRPSTRAPVSLHQDRDMGPPNLREDVGVRRDPKPRRDPPEENDTYASDRDHRDHQHASTHHERRHRKHRDTSPDRPAIGEKVAAVGLGSVAAAGLAGAMSKSSRDNDLDDEVDAPRERRHRRRREKEFENDEGTLGNGVRSERPRDRLHDLQEEQEMNDSRRGKGPRDRGDSDSLEDDVPRNHHHRRRKHHNKDESRLDNDSGSGSESRNPPDKARDTKGRDEQDGDSELDDGERRRHGRDRRGDREQPAPEAARYESVPGELEDDRPRRVQLVEPVKEKEQETKPKGILKPPREVPFPEDPNPTREGVAPLKEATKKGIPPGARWTKINRQLVNPASLEASHERFEERDDYVIVLRVLTREEIEKFAELTAQIRGKWNIDRQVANADSDAEAREREWQERHKNKHHDDSSDEEDHPTLAIEAPPPQQPPADQRYPQAQGLESRPAPAFESRPPPDPTALAGYATEV